MFQREEEEIGKLEEVELERASIAENSSEEDGDRTPTVKEDKKLAKMMENINTVPARQLRDALTLARSKTL